MKKISGKVATGTLSLALLIQLGMPVLVSADSTNSTVAETTNSKTNSVNSSSENLGDQFGLSNKPKLVKEDHVQRGDVVTFDNIFLVSNENKLTKLTLTDPLNKNFSFQSADILEHQPKNDGKGGFENVDVTKTGDLKFDEKSHTLTWNADKPADYFGQLLNLQVKVKVNTDTDLDEIPNQSFMTTDQGDTKTDKVKVTVDHKETPATENHTPKPNVTPKPSTPAKSSTSPVKEAKATPTGLLPQTAQMIRNHLWIAVLAGASLLTGTSYGIYRIFKNKKAEKGE